MTTRNARLLDVYTDYLLASFGPTTATGLSALLPDLSHDQVTRFLSRQELTDKDLWYAVKTHLRSIQSEQAVLILDDTVEEKPYTLDIAFCAASAINTITSRSVMLTCPDSRFKTTRSSVNKLRYSPYAVKPW